MISSTTIDLEYVKQVGIGAAYKGAEALMASFADGFTINRKGDKDLVTDADTASEQAILDTLAYRFPDHTVLAEESGQTSGTEKHLWIIDPLDGTTNFAHGLRLFSVSIAFAIDGDVVMGVVLNPGTGELFTAVQGQPATLNGAPIHVSQTRDIGDALLVTGFPYDYMNHLDVLLDRFKTCLTAAQGVRRLGSASLDLCYIACGRFDGYWEQHLKKWDTAAGMLIARQAGATVTDFSGNEYTPGDREMLATNGQIHQQLIDLVTI
ncbi:MAG: inositol monophosphatase family protein [Thermodesulfobacteriota bacterium]|nr:inositol monophosphatase family protein [Thermodesulfobacteriota bacterium]